jgi:tol-pal system protein YbgF
MNENRILKQQVDAMSAENRNLTARGAELEVKLNEAISQMELIDQPPPAGTPEKVASDYKGALQTFRNKQYDAAIKAFNGLLSGGINEELVPNCHYWIGEALYAQRQYKEAIKKFEKVLTYQTSGKKSYAQFMLGNSYIGLGDKAAARDAFNTFISTYPTSPLIQKAQQRLATL